VSLINANVAAPVNIAAAPNVLSDDSVAYADAEQTADIDQEQLSADRRVDPIPESARPGRPLL
jgi:hypothetical protein